MAFNRPQEDDHEKVIKRSPIREKAKTVFSFEKEIKETLEEQSINYLLEKEKKKLLQLNLPIEYDKKLEKIANERGLKKAQVARMLLISILNKI